MDAGRLVNDEEIGIGLDERDRKIGFGEECDIFSHKPVGKNGKGIVWRESRIGLDRGFFEEDAAFFDTEYDA